MINDGNFLEVSILLPTELESASLLCTWLTAPNCKHEVLKIVGFDAAAVIARSSKAQCIESKGLIDLPCTMATNGSDRHNFTVGDSKSLVVLLRPAVYKKQVIVNFQ